MVYRYVLSSLLSSESANSTYALPSAQPEQHTASNQERGTAADKVAVCYSLGIYLLNLFLAFLTPKFDPAFSSASTAADDDAAMEDGDLKSPLPTKADEEFRPFVRRLPEFKFWVSATRAVCLGFVCTWFRVFDVPVFWPVLVVYWMVLFALTSELLSLFFSHFSWGVFGFWLGSM